MFLDRDGVLNRDSAEFIRTASQLDILPGSAQAAAGLHCAGFQLIVVTNQSGIARGLITETDLAEIHTKLARLLASAGAPLTGIYHCPHGPDDSCDCRKPRPGMLVRAAYDHDISLADSFMVGDRPADIACSAAAGCRGVLVLSGQTEQYNAADFGAQPDFVAADLAEAARWILSRAPAGSPAL